MRDSDVLSALVSRWKDEEADVDGLYAEAAHDSQCDAEEWDAVTGGHVSVSLTFKIDPDSEFRRLKFPTIPATLQRHKADGGVKFFLLRLEDQKANSLLQNGIRQALH